MNLILSILAAVMFLAARRERRLNRRAHAKWMSEAIKRTRYAPYKLEAIL